MHRTRVDLSILLNLLLLTVFGSLTALGQAAAGSIAGQVTDPSGASVPNATIRLRNEATGVERVTKSDENGNYLYPIVSPGFYALTAEATGFRTIGVSGLEIQVAQQVRRDLTVLVGEASSRVDVAATAPVLDERDAAIGQVIGGREVVELPLNGRNYFDLARLSPGVTELGSTSQSNGLAVNGQRANQISFLFDGVDTRTESSGRPAFTPSIEAIQEFRIQTNDFAAEYGRNPAAINLTLRPGGNAFHGTLFEFLRNDALDARSFFSPRVDPLRRNQFGGVFSGPIFRNRTFFMVNYEGLRTRRSSTLYLTVPSEAQRQGNFAGGPTIYDPATYNRTTGQRQPFPGNVIPTERFGLIGRSALKYYPLPNAPGSAAYNYVAPVAAKNDGDQVHTRIDHTFNDADSLFVRYSWSDVNNENPGGLPFTGLFDTSKAHSVTAQESHIFSPNRINQFRAAWTFYDTTTTYPLTTANLTQTDFGLQNLSPATTASGLPQLTVAGLSNIGASPFNPIGQRENVYSLADDYNWIRGRHSMKFGFDGRYYRPAQRVQQTPNGTFAFENRFTNQPGAAGTGSAVADLLLGVPYTVRATQFAESNGLVTLKYYYFGFYAQDEIRIASKLSLNIGLRYEYQTPYHERYGPVPILNFPLARFDANPSKDLIRSDPNNFAPRLGIAWTLNSKTVVRTGAGLFYGSPRAYEFGAFQLSPPFVIDSTIVSDPLVPDLVGRAFPVPVVRNSAGDIAVTPNTNVFVFDPNMRTNYTWQWNFGIQRELTAGWLLETAYLGNSAHKLTGRDLVNQAFPDPDPSRPTPVTSRRPVPQIGDVSYVKSLDQSNYHALAVKLNKRFSYGLSVIGAYTYSKAIGIGGALFGDQSRQQDARNRRAEYAALEFDQKHRATLAWIYELPVGRGKSFAANSPGVLNPLISGWSIQGNFVAHSGFPLTPLSTVTSNVGRQDLNRADRLCDGNLSGDGRSITRWFDTSCFVNHAFGRFGNSGNGVIKGPGLVNLDLTGMKNTRIPLPGREPLNLQFRAEFFNSLNHASFADPNLNAGTAQFGVIRGTRVNGREIQLALKILF